MSCDNFQEMVNDIKNFDKDKVMEDMECWQTMEHFKKCEKCQEEIAKYLEEEELSWRKQRDDEMTEMYSNNDCQRD